MIPLKTARFPLWILACSLLYIYAAIPTVTAAEPGRAGNESDLRINEFLALNASGLTDEDGDRPDWIELFNPGPYPVLLDGWSLTDETGNPRKWPLPFQNLQPGAYLIIFASDKNRNEEGFELHTNFKLDGSGEYLALFDPAGRAVSEFNPAYPEQAADVSFAFLEGAYLPTGRPTPGAENRFEKAGGLPLPVFSRTAGYCDAAFDLVITASPESAEIRFTTDGSEPGPDSATPANGLIRIETTTVLRARAFLPNSLSSRTATATYIFPDDVIRQPDNPPGYPPEWGPFTALSGNAPADYGMDPEITEDPAYAGSMRESLLSLPALSIVTDRDGLFSKDQDPEKGGIYVYTGPPGNGDIPLLGDGWTRPASVELIMPDGPAGFQADCGLRIHGGHSRRPEKTPKHSFRLLFRSEYGPAELEAPFIPGAAGPLNTVILRATYGNTWLHMNQSERVRCQLIHDLWAKDTQIAMGRPSGRGFFVHLYINGLYWGVYNPTERIDADFAADRLGGNAEDYDVVKDYAEPVDGDATAWNRLTALADAGPMDDAAWMAIQGLKPDGTADPSAETSLDAVSLIDYMLINFYGANWDWDHHNWVAVRNRVHPGTGFQFFSWDAEHVIENIDDDILGENNAGRPSRLFQRLKRNPKFLRLLADRIQLHCFNGGALTPESTAARWNARSAEVEKAMLCESGRWGDYRRDVHRWTAGPFELYTPEHWNAERSFLKDRYFPERTAVFVSQLKSAGLFPGPAAPRLYINGVQTGSNTIRPGDRLTMTAATGEIRYTTDGSDPMSGTMGAMIYSGAITLDRGTAVKSRSFDGSEWSGLIEAVFAVPEEMGNLAVSEIHYHPMGEDGTDGDRFEFIELKNTGESTLDLAGSALCRGVSFAFTVSAPVGSGGFVVLSPDPVAFETRYGFAPAGRYDGNLDNGGEILAMTDASGDTLFSFRYGDRSPWPEAADGGGYSLAARDPSSGSDPGQPGYWRLSIHPNGSPGSEDTTAAAVRGREADAPLRFGLGPNYPNPFNPGTRFSFETAAPAHVSLQVFDIRGRRIRTLLSAELRAGLHEAVWDGMDDSGLPAASGVYILRLEAERRIAARKVVIGR